MVEGSGRPKMAWRRSSGVWVKACTLLSVDSLRHQAWSRPAGDSSASGPHQCLGTRVASRAELKGSRVVVEVAETSHRGGSKEDFVDVLRGGGSHGGSNASSAGIGMPAVVKLKDRDTDPIKRLLAIAAGLVRGEGCATSGRRQVEDR